MLTTRHELRRRWVRRWVRLSGKTDAAELEVVTPDTDAREALARFYKILDRVNTTDRTAFVLRFMEGLELAEVAAALGLSLATTKRRLARVWARVLLLVERDPVLVEYGPKFVSAQRRRTSHEDRFRNPRECWGDVVSKLEQKRWLIRTGR